MVASSRAVWRPGLLEDDSLDAIALVLNIDLLGWLKTYKRTEETKMEPKKQELGEFRQKRQQWMKKCRYQLVAVKSGSNADAMIENESFWPFDWEWRVWEVELWAACVRWGESGGGKRRGAMKPFHKQLFWAISNSVF